MGLRNGRLGLEGWGGGGWNVCFQSDLLCGRVSMSDLLCVCARVCVWVWVYVRVHECVSNTQSTRIASLMDRPDSDGWVKWQRHSHLFPVTPLCLGNTHTHTNTPMSQPPSTPSALGLLPQPRVPLGVSQAPAGLGSGLCHSPSVDLRCYVHNSRQIKETCMP